jgi:hypothetical protein
VYDVRAKGLVQHANLQTENALLAQSRLRELIAEDLQGGAAQFRSRFGKEAALHSGRPSFQMHLGKTSSALAEFLEMSGLAWIPEHPDQQTYRELHPDLGQAVMGTIAMACAQDAGLSVVGADSPRGKDTSATLNDAMATGAHDGPYRVFVRKEIAAIPRDADADELFQVVVQLNCRVDGMSADGLAALQADREPLRRLKRHVQQLAREIPRMKNSAQRDEAFRDRANDIVKAWERDRANWGKYFKEIFALDAFGGGMGKVVEKLLPVGAAATFSASISPVAGLAIGCLTHVGMSVAKVNKTERESPWRYMTLASQAGATFTVSRGVGEDARP